MTDTANGREAGQGDGRDRPFGEAFVPGLIWLAGLLSTIYLVAWSSFLTLIVFAFADYSGPVSAWERVATTAPYAIPPCCFLVIGFAGLKLWPRGRRRFWGLSAILLQTVLALCAAVRPDGVLFF